MVIWTPLQKVFCVLVTKSVKCVQGNFRPEFNLGHHIDLPSYVSIMKWDRQLRDTCSLLSNSGGIANGKCEKDSHVLRKKPEEVNSKNFYQAIDNITLQMLLNAWMDMEYRLYSCRATVCAHVEIV